MLSGQESRKSILRNFCPVLARASLVAALMASPLPLRSTAHAQSNVDDLQREIGKRDAQINQLLQRMDKLEKEMRARTAAAAPARRPAEPLLPAGGLVAPPPVKPASPPVAAAPLPASKSDTEAEETMIARALENTLVNQGGQLLPAYSYQIVPDFSYAHQSFDGLAFTNGGATIVRQQSQRNLLEWGLGFRIGLPWETQFGIRVPLDLVSGSGTLAGSNASTNNRGGLGDLSLTLQKQVVHEKGWLPDVLVNAGYKANTGSTSLTQRQPSTYPFTVGTGSGFNAVFGGVTLLKRQDPLVFLVGASYQHSFPNTIGGVDQNVGDQYGFRAEAILAASPDTSLRFGWLNTFQQRNTVRNVALTGTSQQFSSLELGIGSVITPKIFLDAALLVGLTRDTSDFTILFSIPFRF